VGTSTRACRIDERAGKLPQPTLACAAHHAARAPTYRLRKYHLSRSNRTSRLHSIVSPIPCLVARIERKAGYLDRSRALTSACEVHKPDRTPARHRGPRLPPAPRHGALRPARTRRASLSHFGGRATRLPVRCRWTTFRRFAGVGVGARFDDVRHRTTFRRFRGRRSGGDIVACPCQLPPSKRAEEPKGDVHCRLSRVVARGEPISSRPGSRPR
jgi:hypothetical protein